MFFGKRKVTLIYGQNQRSQDYLRVEKNNFSSFSPRSFTKDFAIEALLKRRLKTPRLIDFTAKLALRFHGKHFIQGTFIDYN